MIMRSKVAFYLYIISGSILCVTSNPSKTTNNPTCGYDACPKLDPDKYHIHIVAHTHDDVGWLKTVDQYYYGIHTPGIRHQPDNHRSGIQYVLSSVVRELKENPSRRFIWVETAFFWMWWNRQTPQTHEVVKELVNRGQLEFISGGWSMNDEAATNYQSVIDQMTWGHRRLQDIFGKCAITKIAWQLDPFGHSKEFASLAAQMYFDGLFFARLDYEDQAIRESTRTMELVWKSSQDLGPSSHIFTGAFSMHYYPPQQFCFDDLCKDDPIIDDIKSEEYNVDKKVNSFLTMAEKYSKKYATNHLITTFGGDFFFQNALRDFTNIDLLIKYTNEKQKTGSKYNVLYSTPTCYLKALHDSNRTWTTKSDDFFPYADSAHQYWTGYFTSRPAFKLQERKSNAVLQTCKHAQLWLGENDQGIENAVASLKEAMGVAQHHDAITGTEKQHVANDYALQLNKGVVKCQNVIRLAFLKNMKTDVSFCPSLNVSQCEIMEKEDKVAVILYNLRSQPVSRQIAIPWREQAYEIKDEYGEFVPSDLIPIPESIKTLPERRAQTTCEIYFTANLPPNRGVTFFIEKKPNTNREIHLGPPQLHHQNIPDSGVEFEGHGFKVVFDEKGISGVRKGNQFIRVNQNFFYYKAFAEEAPSSLPSSIPPKGSSGAYIFRPNGNEPVPFQVHKEKPIFVKGSLVSEYRQTISDWISQTIRVSRDSKFIEFDYVVGPIPTDGLEGKEVISRFETDIKNGGVFFTDANGRQLVKRIKDHRDTWNFTPRHELVADNYYPVTSRIIIKDEDADLQLTVLTDRSQGGSSLSEGQIELMVHRRLLLDDGYYVEEALNEPGVDGRGLIIRGKHTIFVGSVKESIIHRDQTMTEYLEPQLFFYPYKSIAGQGTAFLSLQNELPPNIHLLTAESWRDGKVLIRLEHFYESTDDPGNLSKPVTVDLKKFFNIESAVETTLTATQPLSEASRFKWKTADSSILSGGGYPSSFNPEDFTVTLRPMEIRTFIVTPSLAKKTIIVRESGMNAAIAVFLIILLIIAFIGIRCYRTRRMRINFFVLH